MTGTELASWAEGAAKAAIVDFLGRATSPGPDFVPVADRIACFDNDGTLWVEQPLPPQFDFVFRTWAEEVQADPSLADQQPYKALLEKDLRSSRASRSRTRRWSTHCCRRSAGHGPARRPLSSMCRS